MCRVTPAEGRWSRLGCFAAVCVRVLPVLRAAFARCLVACLWLGAVFAASVLLLAVAWPSVLLLLLPLPPLFVCWPSPRFPAPALPAVLLACPLLWWLRLSLLLLAVVAFACPPACCCLPAASLSLLAQLIDCAFVAGQTWTGL